MVVAIYHLSLIIQKITLRTIQNGSVSNVLMHNCEQPLRFRKFMCLCILFIENLPQPVRIVLNISYTFFDVIEVPHLLVVCPEEINKRTNFRSIVRNNLKLFTEAKMSLIDPKIFP